MKPDQNELEEQIDLAFADMEHEEPYPQYRGSLSDEDLLAYCQGLLTDEDLQAQLRRWVS